MNPKLPAGKQSAGGLVLRAAICACTLSALLVPLAALADHGAASSWPTLRGVDRVALEDSLPAMEAAYRAAPRDNSVVRAYADVLFKLGDMWRAREVMAPLATPSSANIGDLILGAKVAYLLGDYRNAETLYTRLAKVARAPADAYNKAIEGLVMVYYQTNQYARAKGIVLPRRPDAGEPGPSDLLAYMQRFTGQPYQITWAGPEKVAHLPIVNEFTAPGALPLVKLEVNGHAVEFILDTGGDRLYIDEAVARQAGIRTIAERRAKYAYTGGAYVSEPLGVADTVRLGEVVLGNVPVIVAKWKTLAAPGDGVVTTQILKQFLSTVDYANKEITVRERSEPGQRQFRDSLKGVAPVAIPFFMSDTHLMFAKGSLNGHGDLNLLVDSGLAMSVPLIIVDETAKMLRLPKTAVAQTHMYLSPIESYGLGALIRGPTQALGNVMVETDAYRAQGFLFDALISHQYLWQFGSVTIDFDSMAFLFPGSVGQQGQR
jgi:hypothetical protein